MRMSEIMATIAGWAPSTRQFRKFYDADIPVDLTGIQDFRGDAFPRHAPECWIDAPDALFEVDRKLAAGELTPDDAEMCRKFIVDGYYIAERLIDGPKLDATWEAYEAALRAGVISVQPESHGEGDPWPGRRLDPHLEVPAIRELQWDARILRITDILFGRGTVPFQTIMGHKGSTQLAHSDAIHMTTYPLGFLVANWISFEDIHPDSGPLFYYPKSHRTLPYLLSAEVGIARGEFKEGLPVYGSKYEPAVQKHLDAHGLERQTFRAKKGDVLFWHANLVHGGDRRNDLSLTRKALVCHYFAERVVTYNDLSGNPSRLHRNGVFTPMAIDAPEGRPG